LRCWRWRRSQRIRCVRRTRSPRSSRSWRLRRLPRGCLRPSAYAFQAGGVAPTPVLCPERIATAALFAVGVGGRFWARGRGSLSRTQTGVTVEFAVGAWIAALIGRAFFADSADRLRSRLACLARPTVAALALAVLAPAKACGMRTRTRGHRGAHGVQRFRARLCLPAAVRARWSSRRPYE
jgi:hypothetical protein